MQRKVIYGYLRGNLGNQLFIYAAIRRMMKKYYDDDCEVVLDDSENIRKNCLINFRLNENIKFAKVKLPFFKRVLRFLFYKKGTFDFQYDEPESFFEYEKKVQPILNKCGLYICLDGYLPMPDKMKNEIVVDGYFQSDKYFNDIRNLLFHELTVDKEINDNVIRMTKLAEETNSICLSLRLGDFVGNSVHQVCSVDYYRRAISIMKDRVSEPVFFVFSDNESKARELFKDYDINIIFEDEGNEDYEKLYMMSRCKHFILSNSSFSWWVQYLSLNSDKIVVAPNRWYNSAIPCDIYQDDWILIEP